MAIDRTAAPKIYDAVDFDFHLPPINKHQLDNGMPLYWLNAGVQDVVEIDWVFPAGIWYEEHEGAAQATAGLLKSGTTNRTAHEINEVLEYYGAMFRVRAGNDNTTVSLFTLTKHLPDVLPIALEVLTEATFPQQEIDIYKQNTIQRLLVSLRQCDFVSNQRIDALLFGEHHPYGRYSKQATISGITQEGLLAHYNKYFNLANAKVYMAGKVGDREVSWLNEIFGKMELSKPEPIQKKFNLLTDAEKKHHITNDENGVQGAIRIGRLFHNRLHEDFAPMVVLNTLFGGYFGSRLMANIREDKGFTYGIYSGMSAMRHDGSIIVQTEVGRDVVDAAIKEIYFEMDKLCNDLADEEELKLVKNYLLGNLLGDLDGPFQILQRWRTLINYGLDTDHFDKNLVVYKNITSQQLRDLAQKYLDRKDYHEVVVI